MDSIIKKILYKVSFLVLLCAAFWQSAEAATLRLEASIPLPRGFIVQGFCYNSASHRFLLAAKTPWDTGDRATQIIMVLRPGAFAKERTYQFHDLGHINTLTYQPEEDAIYVATGGAKWHEYAKVDADSMKVLEKKVCPNSFYAMAYDVARKEYVQCTLHKNTYVFTRYDQNMELKKKFRVKTAYSIGNGLAAHDGELLMFALPPEGSEYGGLEIVGKDGALAISQKVPQEIELEDADYVDGKIYIAANNWKERNAAIYSYQKE